MNLTGCDLNLLIVFDAIFRENNLTLAGRRLGLTQSAMSHALTRLRTLFHDPLFVRQGHRMFPTPLAEELHLNVHKIIDLAEKTFEDHGSFDPGHSMRTFNIAMQDYPMMVLLPRLLREIRSSAPHINIRIFHLNMESRKIALDDGDIELVIGVRQEFGSNIHQQHLFRDRDVCILREDHPSIFDELSFEQYMDAEFIGLAVSEFGMEAIDKQLAEIGARRKIRVTVEQEVAVPHLVGTTDLLANVAELVAREYIDRFPIKILPIPVGTHQFDIMQYWHARNHLDPGHNWLRKCLKGVCERLCE